LKENNSLIINQNSHAVGNINLPGSKSISNLSITFLVLIGILILVATIGKPNIPV